MAVVSSQKENRKVFPSKTRSKKNLSRILRCAKNKNEVGENVEEKKIINKNSSVGNPCTVNKNNPPLEIQLVQKAESPCKLIESCNSSAIFTSESVKDKNINYACMFDNSEEHQNSVCSFETNNNASMLDDNSEKHLNSEYSFEAKQKSIVQNNILQNECSFKSNEKSIHTNIASTDKKSSKISNNISDLKRLNSTSLNMSTLLWLFLFLYGLVSCIFQQFQKNFRKSSLHVEKRRLHWLNVARRNLRKEFKRKVLKMKRKRRHNKSIKKQNLKQSDVNKLENLIETQIRGRRIVDFNYLWQELRRNLGSHGKKCTLQDWRLVKECNHHGGLRSLFCFECQKCRKTCRIWSEPSPDDIMDLTLSSVLGAISEGFGFTQIEGLFASMHLPYVKDKCFKFHQEKLLHHLIKISTASMKAAGEEELRLAREANDVDENGVPFITVIVDGSWIKRSFGNKFDSLSGLGAIIGKRTGKVLYVGVKNKYCTKCHRAAMANRKPTKHQCYKNFPRDKPSTLMESEALIEGFQESFKVHGLVYKYFIGDGDSNFYKRLLDANPYADFKIVPHKIECTNHLLRNLCKKNDLVAKTTQKKGQRLEGFVALRNIVKNNILKIRQAVIDEVDKQLADVQKPWQSKIKDLQKRILNIPSHIFGEHKRCKSYGLTCNTEKEKNYVPYLKTYGLYQKIEENIKYLSFFSESLLHKETNNLVESFNNLVCKVVNGKRVNFACSNQYNTRVAIAILQHNSQEALMQIYTGMKKQIPHTVSELITKRKLKVARTKQSRAENGRKRKYVYSATDKNYGLMCEKPDLTEDQLSVARDKHFQELRENQENRVNIEYNTREQSQSDLWETLRRKLLTASNFGRICRMRAYTSCASTVKSLIFPALTDNVAMAYGRECEDVARKELEEVIKKEIKVCGLFIDPKDPRFAASPDGTIDEDGIVELKNPHRARDLTATEAMGKYPDLNFIDKQTNGMKKTHKWYYQVQGQLHVTTRNYCVFALRTPKSMEIRVVKRDDDFWKTRMEPFLSRFYDNCLLPEILDSRHLRSMPIRNPPYILEAKEKQNQKVAKQKVVKVALTESNFDKPLSELLETKPKPDSKSTPLKEENANDLVNNSANCDDDDDVVFVRSSTNRGDWLPKDIASVTAYFDRKLYEFDLNAIEPIISTPNSWLNDDSIDAFLGVVQENHPDFEVQSVMYLYYPYCVQPAKTRKSVIITGGTCTGHWRFGYYNGHTVRIYDTIPNYTGGKPIEQEKRYIMQRFPEILESDINFIKIKTKQPDGNSCGIYSAGLLTYLILEGDPSKVNLSKDVTVMRQHYLNIIQNRKLALFPIAAKRIQNKSK